MRCIQFKGGSYPVQEMRCIQFKGGSYPVQEMWCIQFKGGSYPVQEMRCIQFKGVVALKLVHIKGMGTRACREDRGVGRGVANDLPLGDAA
jgi:hypothetical protein